MLYHCLDNRAIKKQIFLLLLLFVKGDNESFPTNVSALDDYIFVVEAVGFSKTVVGAKFNGTLSSSAGHIVHPDRHVWVVLKIILRITEGFSKTVS